MLSRLPAMLAAALIAAPLPATAQDMQPRSVMSARDRDNREIILIVSDARPGMERPYRGVVAWAGAPDRYWTMTFGMDCTTRAFTRGGWNAWNLNRQKIDNSFPIDNLYRGYMAWLVAKMVCDRNEYFRITGHEASVQFALDFLAEGQ
jgi:hypothetical protein